MIVIAAPYSPPSRSGYTHLGASRKIEIVITILSNIDPQLVLVNSAHNGNAPALLETKQTDIAGVNLIEITPPLSASRTMGKLRNILHVDQVLEEVRKLGKPQLFWFYNGYAFEMHMAYKAHSRFNVPMILEFEDWHFSRSRELNPKPYVDYFFWRKAIGLMSGTFAVNAFLESKLQHFVSHVDLLPGVVPKVLADIASESPPFTSKTGHINVGFFGGLSAEKGADIVLQLAAMLPAKFTLHVTGSGPLKTDFEACAKERPQQLCFHGRVDEARLYQLIATCDAILNPHVSIENMNNGVFPFKVIEAIASGKLLISTSVLGNGLEDVLEGVLFVDCNAEALLSAIMTSREYYLRHSMKVMQGAKVANQRFGEQSVLEKVRLIVGNYSLSK